MIKLGRKYIYIYKPGVPYMKNSNYSTYYAIPTVMGKKKKHSNLHILSIYTYTHIGRDNTYCI